MDFRRIFGLANINEEAPALSEEASEDGELPIVTDVLFGKLAKGVR